MDETAGQQRVQLLTDRELVGQMRRGERAALNAFFARFRPLLLGEARQMGVQPALRDEVVYECLDDAASTLTRDSTPVRQSLASYLVAALRRKVISAWRGDSA